MLFRSEFGVAGFGQRIRQRFHAAGDDGARAGAAGEDDVGHPDAVGQIGEGRDFAVLVGEREIGDRANHGQLVLLFEFRQREHIGQSKKAEEQAKAQPERSRQMLERFGHVSGNYAHKKTRRKPRLCGNGGSMLVKPA